MTTNANNKYAWHYTPPSGAEVQALLRRWKTTQADAARIVDVTGRTMRRYCDEQPMPFAVLYVLASELAGLQISLGNYRAELKLR